MCAIQYVAVFVDVPKPLFRSLNGTMQTFCALFPLMTYDVLTYVPNANKNQLI